MCSKLGKALDNQLEKYMNIYELALKFYNKNQDNEYFIELLGQTIEKLPNEFMFCKKKLKTSYFDFNSNKNINVLYLKTDIQHFFNSHISKRELYAQYARKFSKNLIRTYYHQMAPIEVNLGGKTDFFVSINFAKELFNTLEIANVKGKWGWRSHSIDQYKKDNNLMELKDIEKILNCTNATVNKLIKNSDLKLVSRYKNQDFFDGKEVNYLFKRQQELIKEYDSKYYTSKQIVLLFSSRFALYIKGSDDKIRFKLTKVSPPLLLVSYYGVQMKLYLKDEIEKMWSEYHLFKNMNVMSLEIPFDDFKYKVETVLKVNITDKQKHTRDIWFQYVEKFFIKTRMSDKSRIIFQTNQFVRCTDIIFNTFKSEIYTYKAKEINANFLNSFVDIKRSYQYYFYSCLKQMLKNFAMEGLPLPFNEEDLNDPREFNKIKEIKTDIYSLEEYQQLYSYINDLDLHKSKAIDDVRNYLKSGNYQKYQKYDSCWLYLIVQLTNNWRHSTVITQIPRIDLSTTSIINLEWLQTHTPSVEDANNIVYQIGRYVQKINKTDISSEGMFNIGEPLKIAFATAISICEFRKRETFHNDKTLIDLKGHLVKKYNPHREFFKFFKDGFKFENRKMNRTLTTLIWSVLRHKGKGVKEAQISRGHLKETTTIKHYIKLNEDYVNELVQQLFERSQFGFVTQALTNIIYGKTSNKNTESEKMLVVNSRFGEVVKIEATAGLVNRIFDQRKEVAEYLQNFDLDGLQYLYNSILTNSLPSFETDHQCVFLKCRYINDLGIKPSCGSCPAAVINIYALNEIMESYINMMLKIQTDFDQALQGEKNKLANQFYLINNIVNQARIKFGRNVVDGFIDGGTSKLKLIGKSIAQKQLKSYQTIKNIEENDSE